MTWPRVLNAHVVIPTHAARNDRISRIRDRSRAQRGESAILRSILNILTAALRRQAILRKWCFYSIGDKASIDLHIGSIMRNPNATVRNELGTMKLVQQK